MSGSASPSHGLGPCDFHVSQRGPTCPRRSEARIDRLQVLRKMQQHAELFAHGHCIARVEGLDSGANWPPQADSPWLHERGQNCLVRPRAPHEPCALEASVTWTVALSALLHARVPGRKSYVAPNELLQVDDPTNASRPQGSIDTLSHARLLKCGHGKYWQFSCGNLGYNNAFASLFPLLTATRSGVRS